MTQTAPAGTSPPMTATAAWAGARRAEGHPRVLTEIHLTYTLTGNLDEDKVIHAIELSEIKHCSVTAMLGKTAAITHEFRIRATA